MGSGPSQADSGDSGVCCCKNTSPRGEISEPSVLPKSAVEILEHGLNMHRLSQAAATAGNTVQNAAGALVEALEDDDKSSETGGQGFFGKSPAPEGYAGHIWVQLESYAHHSHITVKLVGLCIAVGLIVTSVLGMLGVWSSKFQVFEYVHSLWNIPFGFMMIIMDATPTWLGKKACWQTELWKKAPILARARGRALTHFYVGTINLAMFTADESFLWMLIHICMGGSLCACGLLMLFHHHCYQCRRKRHTNANMNGTAAVQNAHKALEVLREEAVEVRAYIAANHCSVRIFCFLVALALVASSILGMLNIFSLLLNPFQYLIGVYNFFFALAIVVLDGESAWFRHCCDCRSRLFQSIPFLATQPGRALLHFYVGTINIAMLPGGILDIVFVAVGGSLVVCSFLMLLHHNYCHKVPDWPFGHRT
ncbi:unnamed protein product [Symbiodinium natans]|uniref:Uncharacterized protein n=1 Tax=Symbiodinium natans TaxID=878477 RepID=A0A812LUY4_9DINO|nr:unnamed protein product [Symbiodinium natans]